MPGLADIQTGTLDSPEGDAPGAQIMCKEPLAWLDRIDALPAFATYPGMG
ncbi:hypothetical protein GCM10022253_05750 [Sphingomonas endophytica]|uniref:Uncharacterized protein n=1 Tax=Sphingomonas endophytica TaxID=869719 RepID=A0A7X0JFL0_9SPHN|nr:hypothetical protein [Sphingomonas endophytica]MBB5724266.1 hypothetical protein [Sphingomonas endophytica]MBB6505767.1 hypothetical protein [Sphingomonas endophytica]